MSQETTKASANNQWSISTHIFAWAGILGPTVFVVVFTLAGFLHPGYSAFNQMISNLGAEEPFAWLQDSNFIVSGLLLIVFAIGFFRLMRPMMSKRQLVVCSVLLVLVGAGLFNEGFCVTDLPGQATTLHGVLHIIGFLVLFFSLIIAQFLTGRQLLRTSTWRSLGLYSIGTSFATLTLILIFFFTGSHIPEYVGLLNRVFVIVAFAWYVVVGGRWLVEYR